MTETDLQQFNEPTGEQSAGTSEVRRQPFPYERYMDQQGIPIHEGTGFNDVRDLELRAWERRGVNGAFLVLDQLLDLTGLYVLEIPPSGATLPERHLYEEKYLVLEGDGIAEVSHPNGSAAQQIEWRVGSLFAIPLNAEYRLINSQASRALLLSANTAPPIVNRYENLEFVFANDFVFLDRYDGSADYFSNDLEIVSTPELGRAMWKTNFIPNVQNCVLPLDNQRSPGSRRIELPRMAGGNFWGFVDEYVSGRYSRAHAHASGAVFVCVRGKGYTYTWPAALGSTPWVDGHGDEVERIDYVPGGVVAAAPGAGDWYHQHFGTGQDPLRQVVFLGGLPGGPYQNYGGRTGNTIWGNADIEEGGTTISYDNEDPHIREEFKRELSANGVQFSMPSGHETQ